MEHLLVEKWSEVVKMDKKTFWIIVGIAIAILVVLLVWQTVKIGELSSATNVARTAGSAASSAASSGGSGMVGGC